MLMSAHAPLRELENPSEFVARHLGPDGDAERHMLSTIGDTECAFSAIRM